MSETISDFSALNVRMSTVESAVVKIADDIGGLRRQFIEGRTTQWPVLISLGSLLFVVISGLGFITMQPMKDKQYELSQDLRAVVRDQLVPRQEMVERWAANTRDLEYLRQRITREAEDLQRQIDSVSKKYTDIYSAPDLIKDLSDRLRSLESLRGWSTKTERQ